MSFIYPRVVAISRPNAKAPTQVGDVGYSAERGPVDETVVATGLPASIQLDRSGQRNPEGLPTDAPSDPVWKLFIPKSAAALGTIRSSDVCTDDMGQRYVIQAPYWNSLGHACRMMMLEV
jgi:hypothetical protein